MTLLLSKSHKFSIFFNFFPDFAGRGTKKFGDTCDSTWECGFPNSICDKNVKKCQCEDRFQATNHIDKCGKCKFFVYICSAAHIKVFRSHNFDFIMFIKKKTYVQT